MPEAPSYTESMGSDSANTILYPPDASDRDGHLFTELLQPHSDAVQALVVTVEQPVEDWLASNQDVEELVEELVVVSLGDGTRSTAATAHPGPTTGPSPDPLADEPIIEFVSDAGNLSELGQTINAHLPEAPDHGNEQAQTVLYMDSISTLLDALDTETVFRFLHMLTKLVNARGAAAYYQLGPRHVDPETVSILSVLFDSNLEGKVRSESVA